MNTKIILAASLSVVFAISMIFAGAIMAEAAKPQENGSGKDVIALSNGFPSGPHQNLNVHGKKITWTGDCTPGGKSINIPEYTDGLGDQTIQFASNSKSSQTELTAIDPCTELFDGSPSKVQLPYQSDGYYVFARSAAKPNNDSGDPSKIMVTPNGVLEACNQNALEDPDNNFGDLTSCYDANGDLVETIVLGLVTNDGVYKVDNEQFVRYDTATSGKGIKKAVDITGLFEWTGAVCSDSLDIDGDRELTSADFGTTDEAIDAVYGDGIAPLTAEEFIAFLMAEHDADCEFFEEEWVFNVADLVVQSQKVNNDGTKLWQVRFYPVATTTYIQVE